MPRERISMRRIRDLLRYHYDEGRSQREIAKYLQLSPGTVRNYLARARAAELSWPLPNELTDAELEVLLFPEPASLSHRPQPDWEEVSKQLARKNMTLERIWHAYHEAHPDGYSYGHFCARFRDWNGSQEVVMRLHHKAGDKLFVDFAGTTVDVINPVCGEVTQAQIFVGTLGCSNYTYVEALPDQTLRSWIGAHVRMLAFFGAVPQVVVC